MVLRLTTEEVDIVRTALRNEYSRLVREFAALHCTGYSERGIRICQQRSAVEILLDQVATSQSRSPSGAGSLEVIQLPAPGMRTVAVLERDAA